MCSEINLFILKCSVGCCYVLIAILNFCDVACLCCSAFITGAAGLIYLHDLPCILHIKAQEYNLVKDLQYLRSSIENMRGSGLYCTRRVLQTFGLYVTCSIQF